jgi:hypothetical protein
LQRPRRSAGPCPPAPRRCAPDAAAPRGAQGLAAMAAEGSWKAYFRGNGCNVVKNVPETAIKMSVNDRIKALIVKDGHPITLGVSPAPRQRRARRAHLPAARDPPGHTCRMPEQLRVRPAPAARDGDGGAPRAGERLVVGASAGGLAQVAVYPLEVIQTRLAATHGAYAGIADAAAKIWRTEGAAAFMRCARPRAVGARAWLAIRLRAARALQGRGSRAVPVRCRESSCRRAQRRAGRAGAWRPRC